MHPGRHGLFLADAAAAVRRVRGDDEKLTSAQLHTEWILFQIEGSAVNIDKVKNISDRPALMNVAGAVDTSASDNKIRKGRTAQINKIHRISTPVEINHSLFNAACLLIDEKEGKNRTTLKGC